ncbi:hypothetical protein FRC11_015064 [Ceratobasidium sp. 423]|nr:hypothetical protein FRC11_015064 [Ceratobasidium sp. 423]
MPKEEKREAAQNEEAKEEEGDARNYGVRAKVVQEKAIAFIKAVGFIDPDLASAAEGKAYPLAALYDLFLEYAQILSAQGVVNEAVRYVERVPRGEGFDWDAAPATTSTYGTPAAGPYGGAPSGPYGGTIYNPPPALSYGAPPTPSSGPYGAPPAPSYDSTPAPSTGPYGAAPATSGSYAPPPPPQHPPLSLPLPLSPASEGRSSSATNGHPSPNTTLVYEVLSRAQIDKPWKPLCGFKNITQSSFKPNSFITLHQSQTADNHRLETIPPELGTLHHLEMLGVEGIPLQAFLRAILPNDGTCNPVFDFCNIVYAGRIYMIFYLLCYTPASIPRLESASAPERTADCK